MEVIPIFKTHHHLQQIFVTIEFDFSDNINNNNKFLQDHVHRRFVNYKGFPTLKGDNFMHKLVKQACNLWNL
jgi:hypothetical protein